MDLIKDYYGKSMIADRDQADGNVSFEKEEMIFRPRSYDLKKYEVTIRYEDIKEVKYYKGLKSTVALETKNGTFKFHMYKMNTFVQQVESGRKYWNVVDAEVTDNKKTQTPLTDEQIDKLSKLAELHKNGVLTDDEFEKEKSLIIDR